MTTVSHAGAGTRALALVFLAAVIEGFDLQAAGVAAPKLAPAFGLQPDQMGLFFSSATFGLMFGALGGGLIADRWGRRAGLALALVAFGVFSVLTVWAGTFEQLLILRFLTGVGLGGALPNLVAIAAESSAPARRGRAVAIMYAGVPLGGAIASAVAMMGLHGDWQSIFLIGGVLPILLVVPLLLLLAPFKVARDAAMPTNRRQVLFAPGTMVGTVLLWSAFFCGLVVVYLLLNWLPQLLVSLGFAREQASLVQVVFNVGGAVGSVIGGRLLDSERPALAAVGCFVGLTVAIALLSAVPAGNVVAALAAGTFVGATLLGAQALLYGLAPQCYPAEVRGTGVGLAVAVGRIGSIVGPLFAGALLASGMGPQHLLYAILPIAAVCGLATVALILRRSYRAAVPA
ncbi:3-(3-hydroxy-phenyl)propionate transporter MhpT [Azospirillum thermophilum]|uniref:3-(3-hydroxy-phenyl)propionate transporter MhpT n=1 Tax=Azospirillum thermophilum TaxID=2202148 RepID=A0A2S2CYU5_9PROT|nr:3-(3-hydroxy-phenyl)propionate transporter MhpT [Azospirillum thermophilum]AWK89648.1 3-(3-hydroxy-phenyl)propionate transporter MhpT [Azospirillum thermophilum]